MWSRIACIYCIKYYFMKILNQDINFLTQSLEQTIKR